MPTPLSSALAAKVKADKLSLTALAKAVGVSSPSVTTALKGKSFPNKSTVPKFAKFLGITVEELLAMKKGKSAAKAKQVKKSKPAKVKPVRPIKANKGITLAEAAELAADDLAVAVYRATAEQRRVITAVLG